MYTYSTQTYTYYGEWLVLKVRIHNSVFVFFSFSFSFFIWSVCIIKSIRQLVFSHIYVFRVFEYGKFLDSHVVIWMLHFTDIVSTDVATIVESMELCKSQNRTKKSSDTKAAAKTTTITKTTPTDDEWKIYSNVKERMRNMLDIDERQCAHSYAMSSNCLIYRKMMIFHDDDDEVGKDDVFSRWTMVFYLQNRPSIEYGYRIMSTKSENSCILELCGHFFFHESYQISLFFLIFFLNK